MISNIQSNVLLGLARYQYLTFSQMLELEVGTKYYQYLWKQVTALRDKRRALVACHNYSTPQPKRGKVESLYYLTSHGKRALMEELRVHEKDIKKPTSRAVAYKDYHHRKGTISFHIALDRWAKKQGLEVPFFDTYFEKSVNAHGTFYAKTRIDLGKKDYIIPDGAYKVINENTEQFYLFELHRGTNTGRLVEQVHQHAQCLTQRLTHGKYELAVNKGYSIILLFELESTKQAFLQRIQREGEVFQQVQQYFLLQSIQGLQELGFDDGWVNLFGEECAFFE